MYNITITVIDNLNHNHDLKQVFCDTEFENS